MKHIVIVSLICLFGQFGLFAQDGFIRIPPHDNDSEPPQIVSAGGAFDVIHDRFGNKYWLSDLRTDEVVNGTVKLYQFLAQQDTLISSLSRVLEWNH